MVDSVGKRLRQSRISKKLSIEECARTTKIRPERIQDLEEDDYSNFPSLTYARGFLVIYAKFLGVDVTEFAESIGNPNAVGLDDYEYLSSKKPAARPTVQKHLPKKSPLPYVITAAVVVIVSGIALLWFFISVTSERLGFGDKKQEAPVSTPPVQSVAPVPSPTPVPTPIVTPPPAAQPEIEAPRAIPVNPAETQAPTPSPAESSAEDLPVRRAVPVQ